MKAGLIVFTLLYPLAFEQTHADVMYVANAGNNTVRRFDLATAADLGVFATGLNIPKALAFDSEGNLFVSNLGDNTIAKITPSGAKSVFASKTNDPFLAGPEGLAFDSAGNLYVANGDSAVIERFTAAGGVGEVFGQGNMQSPVDLAFDREGNLFVADYQTSQILKFQPDGLGPFMFANSAAPFDPRALAFDRAGNLFVANANSHNIQRFTPAGASSVFYVPLAEPSRMAFGPDGALYLINASYANVTEIEKFASDGRYLGPFTQSGLNAPSDIAIQVQAPKLNISKIDTATVRLAWPSAYTNYTLQRTTNLASPDWSDVTSVPQADGTNRWLLIPCSSPAEFYRLAK